MSKINYILTAKTVIVNFENNTHTVDKGTVEYEQIVKCLKDKKIDDIPNIINTSARLNKYSNGKFSVESGVIVMDGEMLPSQLSDRILSFEKDELPYEPLVNFWNNLKNNPSYRARHQLFNFLEHNGHPITDDGCFIAYKGVTANFKDCHTNTFDNSVGSVVSMPREKVDDDPANTCSAGLHVASYDYAHNYYGGAAAGLTVEVKVNPADVVAVPADYNGEKMRVCRYEVIGISKGERKEQYVPYMPSGHDSDNLEEFYRDAVEEKQWYDDYIDYSLKELDEDDSDFSSYSNEKMLSSSEYRCTNDKDQCKE